MVLLLITIVLLSFLDLKAQNVEDSIMFSIDLDNVVISGQSLPTDSKNATYKVETITKEQILNRGQTQLQEALAQLPNVRITNDPTLGTSLKLRGITSDNVNILIDGVPVVGRLNGGIDLSHINLSEVKRIELIEGPLSALYGNNAAGGVINIITEKSIQKNYKLRVDTQYELPGIHNYSVNGTMQSHGFFISASGRYSKHQLYPLDSTRIFTIFEDDGGNIIEEEKYPWNPKEQWALNTTLRYNFGDNAFAVYRFNMLDEQITDLGKLTRPQFKPYAWDKDYSTDRRDHSFLFHQEWKNYIGDLTLAQNGFKRLFTTERYNFDDASIDPSLTRVDTNMVDVFFTKANLASRYYGPINFLLGINYNRESARGDRIEAPGQENPNLVSVDDLSLFGNLDISPTRELKLSGSGRWFRSDIYGDRITPAFQLKWNSSKALTWRASFATGFRVPTLKERFINFIDINHFIVSNPDLRPESSRDFSLNINYENSWWEHLIQVGFSSYYTEIEDKIVLTAFESGKFNYRNLQSFNSRGVNSSFKISNKKWAYANSFGIAGWTSDEVSVNQLRAVFDMQHSVETRLLYDLKAMLQLRYVGAEPRFAEVNDEIVESTIEAYSLIDLHLNRKFDNDRYHIGFGIKNILDISSTNIIGSTNVGGVNPHETGTSSQLVNQGRSVYFKLLIELSK